MEKIKSLLREYSVFSHFLFSCFFFLLHLPFLKQDPLKKKDEALLAQTTLLNAKPPNQQNIFLTTWMRAPSMGNVYLLGPDSDVWVKPDLICTKAKQLLARKLVHKNIIIIYLIGIILK
jgi:hypothetical protein